VCKVKSRLSHLKRGDYTLKIDGQEIITYPNDQFARGINLSQLATPISMRSSRKSSPGSARLPSRRRTFTKLFPSGERARKNWQPNCHFDA
jgi:hypothetical protein